MKKLFLLFLIAGTILPSFTSIPSAEAGSSPEGVPRRPRNFSPEGRHRPRKKPRCKTHGKVTVCKCQDLVNVHLGSLVLLKVITDLIHQGIQCPPYLIHPLLLVGRHHIKEILTISFFIVILNPYNIIL